MIVAVCCVGYCAHTHTPSLSLSIRCHLEGVCEGDIMSFYCLATLGNKAPQNQLYIIIQYNISLHLHLSESHLMMSRTGPNYSIAFVGRHTVWEWSPKENKSTRRMAFLLVSTSYAAGRPFLSASGQTLRLSAPEARLIRSKGIKVVKSRKNQVFLRI